MRCTWKDEGPCVLLSRGVRNPEPGTRMPLKRLPLPQGTASVRATPRRAQRWNWASTSSLPPLTVTRELSQVPQPIHKQAAGGPGCPVGCDQ